MPETAPKPPSVPSRSGLVRTIAFMNQKGGVGKTTTTVNLAAGVAALGRSALVIDLDPQAHASIHLGVDAQSAEAHPGQARSVYDLLLDPTLDAMPAIRSVNGHLSVLPAETDLAALETELSAIDPAERTTRLRTVIERLRDRFEFIFIDCPPSLGVLTLNGLAAAREVFIPMQAHFLALQGVSKLLETVGLVGKSVNPRLRVTGVILCMHDPSSTHSREVVEDLTEFFESTRRGGQDVPWSTARVLQPAVRRNIKLAECPSFGKSIFDYAPFCPGSLDYKALAEKVVGEWDALLARRATEPASAPASAERFSPPRAPAPVANPQPVVKARRPAKSDQRAEAGA